MKLEFSLQIF